MSDGDSLKAGAKEIEARTGSFIDAMDLDPGTRGITVFGAEGVIEDALDRARSFFVGVERKASGKLKTEGSQVVEAKDVIGVAVGVEHSVDVADVFADCLGVKVRTGIDKNETMVVREA
jgi:hypothetical protein